MLVICPNCKTRLQLDESKIPSNVSKARCPKCQGSVDIRVSSETDSDLHVSLPADMTPPSPPVSAFERPPAAAPFKQSEVASDASQSPNGYTDFAKVLVDLLRQKDPVADKTVGPKRPAWDRRKTLVCTDVVHRQAIAEGLATLDFEVYVAENTAEALGRMREDRMDVLVLEAGFDPVEQGFAFVMREIKLMRPAERRRLFFVFVTQNARTMDLHAAFLNNANLVVNPTDIERMPDALEVSLRHYNELYREFNRALDVAPI
jgi:predicted Zn finger-like uncharacterized protein